MNAPFLFSTISYLGLGFTMLAPSFVGIMCALRAFEAWDSYALSMLAYLAGRGATVVIGGVFLSRVFKMGRPARAKI